MTGIDKVALGLGVYVVGFFWSASNLISDKDVHSFSFIGDMVLTVVFGVSAIWTGMRLGQRNRATALAHIDTEGAFAALKCTNCDGHIVWIENGHTLNRLSQAQGGHECSVEAAQADQSGGES